MKKVLAVCLMMMLVTIADAAVIVTDHPSPFDAQSVANVVTGNAPLGGTGLMDRISLDYGDTVWQSFTLPSAITIDSLYIGYNDQRVIGTITLAIDAGNDGTNDYTFTNIALAGLQPGGGNDGPVHYLQFDVSTENITLAAGQHRYVLIGTSENGQPVNGTGFIMAPIRNKTNTYAGGQSGTNAANDEVFAITELALAANTPNPADGQGLSTNPASPLFIPVDAGQILSWQAGVSTPIIDPSYPQQFRLYMDPNETKVAVGTGCQYFRDFSSSTSFDPVPDLEYSKQYYWRVDTRLRWAGSTEPNIVTGNVWSFKTAAFNSAPVVDAGKSIVTWLANAQAGLDLSSRTTAATLYDAESDSTLVWSLVSSQYPDLPYPGVTFSSTSVLNPVVTISSFGSYTLKVVAADGVNPVSESLMKIDVYSDACEAAKKNPNTAYVKSPYDYNDNCIVDMEDLAIFAGQWLTDTYATTNQEYTAGDLSDKDLLLWLDASDTNTLTISDNKVSRWNDKSGSGSYMLTGGTGGDPNYVATGLNGKGIVDFGPVIVGANNKWMQLKKADGTDLNLSTIRTVFWIIKGTNFLLGDDNTYHFHRADFSSATSAPWSSTWASTYVVNGKTYLNGLSVNGTTTGLPADYSLVSLVTTNNVEASRLCNDRNMRTGGQQIAEIIVFNRALSDSERQKIEADLKAKWGIQ